MRKLGFTIIEVSVAITLLGILLAVSTLGLQNYLAGARDRERKDDLQSIASHLESYYQNHGQYPTVDQFKTEDGVTLDPRETLTSLAIDDITAPNENSISFNAKEASDNVEPTTKTYQYTPVCGGESDSRCRSFTLSVKLENSDDIFTIESKRQ